MKDAWFRRGLGFGYVPINCEGVLVLACMAIVFVPFAVLFVTVAEPKARWAFVSVAALAAIAGHAVILWKFERH